MSVVQVHIAYLRHSLGRREGSIYAPCWSRRTAPRCLWTWRWCQSTGRWTRALAPTQAVGMPAPAGRQHILIIIVCCILL